jgi:hypothetical protein
LLTERTARTEYTQKHARNGMGDDRRVPEGLTPISSVVREMMRELEHLLERGDDVVKSDIMFRRLKC